MENELPPIEEKKVEKKKEDKTDNLTNKIIKQARNGGIIFVLFVLLSLPQVNKILVKSIPKLASNAPQISTLGIVFKAIFVGYNLFSHYFLFVIYFSIDNLNMKKKFNFYKREIIIVYCLVILGLVIITIKKHKDFDNEIENFALMSNNMKNSKCKDNCLLKFNEDPDKLKVCKSYCKCKKKCYSQFGNKKCKEQCKEKN